jgi:DNA-binding CsgD family transcriptional regulator
MRDSYLESPPNLYLRCPLEGHEAKADREAHMKNEPADVGGVLPFWSEQFFRDGEEYVVLNFSVPTATDDNPFGLTPTEWEVVGLILAGLSNELIASRRRRSARTVANQLQSIYRKVGVFCRVELARKLCEVGQLRATDSGEPKVCAVRCP